MKIGLRAGHSDNCTGAIGIVNEHDHMKLYYIAIRNVLEKFCHIVIDCNSNGTTPNEELSEGATKANNNNIDLFISLHMNYYDGLAHGTEALVYYPYAQKLVTNFSKLGFTNRGIKFASYYEMKYISAPNIILEICFCDNNIDMAIYNQYSWEQLAYVFCNAIDSEINLNYSET